MAMLGRTMAVGFGHRVEALVCNYGPLDRNTSRELYEDGVPALCPSGTIRSSRHAISPRKKSNSVTRFSLAIIIASAKCNSTPGKEWQYNIQEKQNKRNDQPMSNGAFLIEPAVYLVQLVFSIDIIIRCYYPVITSVSESKKIPLAKCLKIVQSLNTWCIFQRARERFVENNFLHRFMTPAIEAIEVIEAALYQNSTKYPKKCFPARWFRWHVFEIDFNIEKSFGIKNFKVYGCIDTDTDMDLDIDVDMDMDMCIWKSSRYSRHSSKF
ncbi:hypothetical protein WN51_11737 [Melipona quadrifasciata]|uniref:Uncharacterized protein n=1 Tax=Melipona quadrifasciata TaxID=166423 RepID=A0A0N0BHN8_9HYME|nr:hypothetical protein WN51_11737 [Melipona quadrifasciata]